MDHLANIFFTQLLNELFQMADQGFEDQRLPVHVTLILEDFASVCRINEFPRLISSMRSRNISSILTLQSEAQLYRLYGEDAETIKACCDTYIFMGTNDLVTAEDIAKRTGKHVSEILSMPPGNCWIFRRGDLPVYTKTLDIDTFLKRKKDT
jgi:type IV secretion system protein VirD4